MPLNQEEDPKDGTLRTIVSSSKADTSPVVLEINIKKATKAELQAHIIKQHALIGVLNEHLDLHHAEPSGGSVGIHPLWLLLFITSVVGFIVGIMLEIWAIQRGDLVWGIINALTTLLWARNIVTTRRQAFIFVPRYPGSED